jgi:hypothetical protein
MNESEQLRLENYFRWYYGYNFWFNNTLFRI